MTNQTQIGIHIKATADVSGLDKAERATEQLAAETRQLEQAFESTAQGARELEQAAEQIGQEMRGAGNETEKAAKEFWEFQRGTEAASKEVEELSRRTEAHADRLREVMRVQKEMGNAPDPFQAEGIVRAYEREQYELEKRRAVSKEDWMERQNYLKQEREERDKVRDATIKQAQAERELKNAESWEKRRADMKEEQEERNRIRQATIQQGVEERKAAREAEQAWSRRKDMIQDFALAAIAAVGAFAKESYTAFATFDDSIRQVATIAPEWRGDIKGLTAETKALSREWRIMPEVMAATMYAAQGLGSMDIMGDAELVSKAAIAGRADATATMEAVLKTQNAFAEGMYDTENILDIFFKTIDLGAVSMDDLASGISEVTSVAGETNTPLEDVAAALITMTRQGDSFNEAVELSGLLLMQLGTEGSAAATAFMEATGKSYRQFIADGGSLGEAMQALQTHAKDTGQEIGAMLSGNSPFFRDSQAARAAMELSGIHLERLIGTTEEMYSVAGTMSEAYTVMADSSQRDIDRMAVAWENLKLTTGEYIASLGWVESGINNVAQAIEYLSGGTGYDLGQMVEENKAASDSAEDLTEEATRLRAAWAAADGQEWAEAPIEERMREIALATAAGATSMEDYQAKLKAVFGDMVVIDDYGFGEGFEEASVQIGNSAIVLGNASELMANGVTYAAEAIETQRQEAIEAARALGSYEEVMGDVGSEMEMMAANGRRAAAGLGEATAHVRELAEVSKVLDGDTLRLEGVGDLRLLGVNTPETAKDWMGKAGMPFGEEALRFTQDFLIDPQVSYEASGTDPHGRMLASVFNGDGASLEHELVAAGLALPMPVHMVGDEELVAELQALAQEAAKAGEGVFADDRVADAFLSGRLEDMTQVAAMYEELAAADEAYYSAYVGHITNTVESLEEMQAALAAAAVQKALLEGNVEAVPAILDMAVSMGVMSEEQSQLQLRYAESMMAIEAYAVEMGEMETITADASETMMLLATGLFDSTEAAHHAALQMDGDTAAAFYKAANGAATLEAAALRAGIELEALPKEVSISIISDTSRFTVPSLPAGSNQAEIQAYGRGGRVEGGMAGRDSVPALLMPDEYVIRAPVAQSMGYDVLDQINQGASSMGSVGGGDGGGGGGGAITVHMPVTFNFTGGATPDVKAAVMEVMEQQQRELQTALLRVGRKD